MARDPPDVGGAPEDVVVPEVEHFLRRRGHAGEIAAGGVHDPLRLAGGARRVEDEQHVLRVHRLARADRGSRRASSRWYQWSRPSCISTYASPIGPPARRCTTTTCLTLGALLERLVGVALERNDLAAAVPAVRRSRAPSPARRSCGRAATRARTRRTPPSGSRRCARTRASRSRPRESAAGRCPTRSPLPTPSDLRTFANCCTSRYRSQYVSVRRSPGSPSQMIAALLRAAPRA